ncbi:Glutaredoxin-like domain (DUF836) [Musa troglodytarum]|uniref:Glutaredoxin-like protein n=1 Tax=Musa troglodytarum TaxID=320322 RepID=A0A9E7L999_9LILI|nr:Glutaredoxin-like domain (DUF836) [Musa troglodytarum]
MAALVSSVSLAALAARLAPRRAWVMARWSIRGPLVVAATAAFSAGGGSGEEVRRHLVLYKKPGCCLCDGLEEKLHAALSLAGGPHSLPSVDLQVRDITGNPEWEMLYQYEIPVLAKVLPDGTETFMIVRCHDPDRIDSRLYDFHVLIEGLWINVDDFK